MTTVISKSGRKLHVPNEAEDEAINTGIVQDPDTDELGAEFFATAKPACEVLGNATVSALKRAHPIKNTVS